MKRLLTVSLLLILTAPALSSAQEGDGVAGRKFKVFFYGADIEEVSAIITFKDNLTLLIDLYEGFGIYVPAGTGFAGIYSAPKYNKEDNLFMLLTGVVVSDFLGGAGISLVNLKFGSILVFFGYSDA